MIRLLWSLVLLALAALGISWLADRPGEVVLTWAGWRIETSLMVAALGLVIIVAVLMALWWVVRSVMHGPEAFSLFMRARRRARGLRSLTQGLLAVGVGDTQLAHRASRDATRLLGDEPLTLLLAAQSAQLEGNREGAQRAFRAMLDAPETRGLGLRGLFIEARRRGDAVEARRLAEEAMGASPDAAWAGVALLEITSASHAWDKALEVLARNVRHRLVDKKSAKRSRMVLLTAKAYAEAETAPESARAAAVEAVGLDPDFAPAAALAGRLLAEANDMRRATKIVERAWRAMPHPDLAEVYVHARRGDSAKERLKRAQRLAERVPGNPEGALAVARAAMAARDFAAARRALSPLLTPAPTQRVCLLMAELEEASNDAGRAREWLARAVHAPADPAWVADGVVSEAWQAVSPVSGQLDVFTWRTPPEHIGAAEHGVVIPSYAAETQSVVASLPVAVEAPNAPEPEAAPPPHLTSHLSGAILAGAPAASLDVELPKAPRPARKAKSEMIIPTPRPPDDPGPDAAFDDGTPRHQTPMGGAL